MRQIHTAIVTSQPSVAKLWATEQDHATTILPVPQSETLDQPVEEFELEFALYENVKVVQHPDEIKANRPDVVLIHTPGALTSTLAKMFRHDSIRVVGGGVINDTLSFNTESVRNILDDMRPDQTRRFIRTHARPWTNILTDLLWTKLRHGQDHYWVEFPSGQGLGRFEGRAERAANLSESALSGGWGSLHHDYNEIGGLIQRYDDMSQAPLCLDVVAMFSRCKGQVAQSGDVLHTGRFLQPRLGFCEIGTRKMGFILPHVPELEDVMAKLALMLSSLEFSGALRMRFSWDDLKGWRLFDILPSCEEWQLSWWRCNIGPDQSWHSLWHSVARGANFDFLMSEVVGSSVSFYLTDNFSPRPAHYSQGQWDMFQHFCDNVLYSKVQKPEPNLEEKEGIADVQLA